jgi:hypothetical protein
MKSYPIKFLYLTLAIVAIVLLYVGHTQRKSNMIILGTGVLILSLFVMHYPLSWKDGWIN